MKWFAQTGRAATLTASFGLAAPVPALAAEPIRPASQGAATVTGAKSATPVANVVADVALDETGALNGQAVNLQGQPLAGATIVLDDGRKQVAATADAQGQFRFDGLRGGAYRVQAGQQMKMCRAWKAGTAPPAANRGLMIVEGDQTVLGQYCATPVGGGASRLREIMYNPLVIGGVLAAAIAIPVALHNSDDDDPAS
jgi:hypothetical protein